MAGSFLSQFVENVFCNMASSWAMDGLREAWGADVDSKFQNLKRKFSTIQAVLEDAEEQQFESRQVQDWLQRLKQVVYDAGDMVEEIDAEAQESNCAESGSEGGKKRKRVWDSFSSFRSRRDLTNRIRGMNARLDEIEKEKRGLHLESRQGSKQLETIRGERRLVSSVRDESSQFLGRTADKEQIMKWLMSDDDSSHTKFSVVGIVGMGGMGKTTLAQVVYNDKTVTERFEVKAWVCVSEHFDVQRITKEIIGGAGKSTSDLSGLDNLQCRLREIVEGKKYLVVLDDVWSEDSSEWERLQAPLTFGAGGSRIMVTTRSRAVLNAMQATWTHDLKGLSQNDCRSLFVSRAFKDEEESKAYPKLLEIGEKLVEKCGGLPLAAKAMGGLLACIREEEDWESILKSRIWNLEGSASNILPALRLSYQHLPAHLKRCFTFCSVFSKDYVFKEENLINMWIAHGFIREEEGKEIEKTGSKYFNDLLLRSFFQCESGTYKMHDLVHDLAQFIAGHECFEEEEGKSHDDPSKIRHLSCTVGTVVGEDELINLEPFYKSTGLRTLLVLKHYRLLVLKHYRRSLKLPEESFERLRFIRVLDLSLTGLRELPNSIGNLKLLRYLNLSGTQIKELPESICSIYSMKTLLLRSCSELTELPNEMRKLIRLRHLDLYGCDNIISMPPEIGRLVCLQELTLFVVGRERGSGIAELKKLGKIRGRLRIKQLENVADSEEARQANLKDKPFIDDLELVWSGNCNHNSQDEGVEEEIGNGLQPLPNLKSLCFKGYRAAHFPSWMMKVDVLMRLSRLHTLQLYNCKRCSVLPPLGCLPSLSVLYIWGMEEVKQVEGDFPSLQQCFIHSCPQLRQITSTSFPKLKRLQIAEAHNLEQLEGNFPCLKDLDISQTSLGTCEGHDALPLLPSLRELSLFGDISEGIWNAMARLTSLSALYLYDVRNRTSLPRGMLQRLTRLKDLTISCWPQLVTLLEEENGGLPDQHHHLPSTLTHLSFYECPNLQSLPRGLHALTCLQTLRIENCPRVTSLPEGGLPIGLQMLRIENCAAELEKMCERGRERRKYAKSLYMVRNVSKR